MIEVLYGAIGTAIAGVITFFICEYIRESFFLPYHEFKQIRNRILSALVLYANVYSNPYDIRNEENHQLPERYSEASLQLRTLASELSRYALDSLVLKRARLTKCDIEKIGTNLIFLSNNIVRHADGTRSQFDQIGEARIEIKKILQGN